MELLEGYFAYANAPVIGNAERYNNNCTGFSRIFLTS